MDEMRAALAAADEGTDAERIELLDDLYAALERELAPPSPPRR